MNMTVQNNASALRAFSCQMQVSSNNVANSRSEAFKADRAYNVEGENGQVKTSISKTRAMGPMVEDPLKTDGALKELSNTNIAEEMIGQMQTQNGFEANATAIRTIDEITGTIVDTLI